MSGCGFVADQRAQSRQRHRATNHPSYSPLLPYQLLPLPHSSRNDGNDRTLLSLWPRAVAAPRLEYFSNFCASKFKSNFLAVKQPNWLTTLRMRDVRLQQQQQQPFATPVCRLQFNGPVATLKIAHNKWECQNKSYSYAALASNCDNVRGPSTEGAALFFLCCCHCLWCCSVCGCFCCFVLHITVQSPGPVGVANCAPTVWDRVWPPSAAEVRGVDKVEAVIVLPQLLPTVAPFSRSISLSLSLLVSLSLCLSLQLFPVP